MRIKFIELFAGIGGFRLGFKQACASLGLKPECVFSSEINKFARQTYAANFGEEPAGDITKISSADIYRCKGKNDILFLFAGFPCQPFSKSGKMKGWSDERNMIPHMLRVIEDKKPDVFILENVKGFKSKKFKDIYNRLMWELKVVCGYTVYERIYNAKAIVPQNRERVFFVGFKNEVDFKFPELPELGLKMRDVLFEEVPEKYTLYDKTWNYLQRKAGDYRNGFGYRIAEPEGTGGTLTTRYKNDGAEILIEQKGNNPRRMTPRECARYMGFPDSFKIVVSDSQAYKQLGNAVVPAVVECIAEGALRVMEFKNKRTNKKSRKKIEYNPLLDAALNTMRNNFLYRMG